MTALGLRSRPVAGVGLPATLLLAGAVAVWTAVVVNAFLGFVPMRLPNVTAVAFGVPLALGGAALLHKQPPRPLVLAAGWSALLAAALFTAAYVPAQPLIGLAIPTVVGSAAVCRRRPAAALVGAFFLTGAFGSLEVFTPIPAGETVDLLLAGLWLGVIWAYAFRLRDHTLVLWPGIVAGMLYLVLTAAAIAGAEAFYDGLYAFRTSAWYMMAFLLIGYAGWDRATYRRIVYGFVAVAGVIGGYATFRWIVGPSQAEEEAALAIAPQFEVVNGEVRLFGSFANGKELAAWTASVIPFCVAIALMAKGRGRVLAVAAIAVCAVGLLGSQTRAALVAVVAGLVLVLILYQAAKAVRGLHLGVTAAAVIAIFGAGFVLFTQTAGDSDAGTERYKILLTDPTSDPAYQARIYKWRDALDDIEANPLGNGLGSAGRAHLRYGRFVSIASSNIDNSYLTIAYQQGFAVMGLFVLTILLLLYGLARRAVTTMDRDGAAIAIGACGALAAFAILLWSGGYYEGLPALTVWMLVGLGVAQFAVRRNRGRPQPGPAR